MISARYALPWMLPHQIGLNWSRTGLVAAFHLKLIAIPARSQAAFVLQRSATTRGAITPG
jgi:hypothetical protein